MSRHFFFLSMLLSKLKISNFILIKLILFYKTKIYIKQDLNSLYNFENKFEEYCKENSCRQLNLRCTSKFACEGVLLCHILNKFSFYMCEAFFSCSIFLSIGTFVVGREG